MDSAGTNPSETDSARSRLDSQSSRWEGVCHVQSGAGQEMSDVWAFISLVLIHWGAYVSGGAPWALDEGLKRLSDRYRTWADGEGARRIRRRVEVGALLIGILVASFQAWQEQLQATQSAIGERQDARGSSNYWHTIAVKRRVQIEGLDGKGGLNQSLADMRAHNQDLQAQLKEAQNQPPKIIKVPVISGAAGVEASRDPDKVYQLGQPVGDVSQVDIRLHDGTVTFGEMENTGNLDRNATFEYRQYTLQMQQPPRTSAGLSIDMNGTTVANKLEGVVCKIIGTRR
jgi:hypothetical protein